MQSVAGVSAVPSLEIPVTTDEDATTLSADLDKAKALIADFESTETITVCWHEAFLEEVKKRHAEKVKVCKETYAENADSLINDVRGAKADSVKMSIERNLNLARFEGHVRAVQALLNANFDRKVTLKDAMTTVRELLQSGYNINKLDFSVKIPKLTQELQRLSGLVKSKGLELQTTPGLVEEASYLREELSKAKVDKDRLSAENKDVLALEMGNSEAKMTTGALGSSLQEFNTRAVGTERDL